jgi:aspartate aminotransferase
MPGLACHQPKGAFYLFVDVSGTLGKKLPGGTPIASDADFCRGALQRTGVALMPGKEFGLPPFFQLFLFDRDRGSESCAGTATPIL